MSGGRPRDGHPLAPRGPLAVLARATSWPAATLTPADSVVDADRRSWDVPNLWIRDGSVLPTVGRVDPSLTIQAVARRTADRTEALAARGELSGSPDQGGYSFRLSTFTAVTALSLCGCE